MSADKQIHIIFGGASIGRYEPARFQTVERVEQVLDWLEHHGIHHIDTAQGYYKGSSEVLLGSANACARSIIDTKFPGGFLGKASSAESILAGAKASLERLKTGSINIFYIHAPDPLTPLSELLAGVQAFYETGGFKKFGLSNFDAEGVQAVYDHCKAHGYVLPTVSEMNYNAFSRHGETTILPLLRKLGIACYAYSPLAGSFLAKSRQAVEAGEGRFNAAFPIFGPLYTGLYCRPLLVQALVRWREIAADQDCSPADLAHRWLAYHSALQSEHGDGIVIGAGSEEQLRKTVTGLKAGPLKESCVNKIDDIWESIREEAPIDNFHR